jgi:hypothetical protein
MTALVACGSSSSSNAGEDAGGDSVGGDTGPTLETIPVGFAIDGCFKSILNADATHAVAILILERIPLDSTTASRCEDLGPAYCTPGAAPCRRDGSPFPPASIASSLYAFNDMDGSTDIVRPSVIVDGRETWTGSDGRDRLICETLQLAGGSVPQSETDRCATDVTYTTPSVGGGWCYSTDPTIDGPTCVADKAPGTLRLFGMPQASRDLYFHLPTP